MQQREGQPSAGSTLQSSSKSAFSSGLKEYKNLPFNQDYLSKTITTQFPTTESLIVFITEQLSKGMLAEGHFIELMSNLHYKNDLKKYKDRIDNIFISIINIYVDTLCLLDRNAINSIKPVELCSPHNSGVLKNITAQSLHLTWFIIRHILGHASPQSYAMRDRSVDNIRVLQRALRFEMWINIAEQLQRRRNEMGCITVTLALENQCLGRLYQTPVLLSPNAKACLESLKKFRIELTTSDVGANYYLTRIKMVPIIPSVHYMLRPLFQVATNEGEQTNNQGAFAKILANQVVDEEVLRLLKEQHHIYASVLPSWEFIASQIDDMTQSCFLSDLKQAAVTPVLYDDEEAYQISAAIEPVREPHVRHEHGLTPEAEKLAIPNGLLSYPPPREKTGSQLLAQPLASFKKWLQKNYFNKLDTLRTQLLMLRELKALAAQRKQAGNPQIDDPLKAEGFVVLTCQTLHVTHVLRRLGDKLGFKVLGIDENLLAETEELLESLKLDIKSLRETYYDIRQSYTYLLNETNGSASLKCDISDIHNTCVKLLSDINEFCFNGSIFQLISNKRKVQELVQVHQKYKELWQMAQKEQKNLGEKIYRDINTRFDMISQQVLGCQQRMLEKEHALVIMAPEVIKSIIINVELTLIKLDAQLNDCPFKETDLKKYKLYLLSLIETLEERLFELPSTDNKYYLDNPDLFKRVSTLRAKVITFIKQCQEILGIVNHQLLVQASKKYSVMREGQTQPEMAALVARQSSILTSPLRSMRTKLPLDLNKLFCRRINLPIDLKLGKFISDRGSFFSSLAHILGQRSGSQQYDEKQLRTMCYRYYLENRDTVLIWQGRDSNQAFNNDPYYKIQYNNAEIRMLFNSEVIGGNHNIEARMLCATLNLPAMYVVQLTDPTKDNVSGVKYFKVTLLGCAEVKEMDYAASMASETPVLLQLQNGCYVPIVRRAGVNQDLLPQQDQLIPALTPPK